MQYDNLGRPARFEPERELLQYDSFDGPRFDEPQQSFGNEYRPAYDEMVRKPSMPQVDSGFQRPGPNFDGPRGSSSRDQSYSELPSPGPGPYFELPSSGPRPY